MQLPPKQQPKQRRERQSRARPPPVAPEDALPETTSSGKSEWSKIERDTRDEAAARKKFIHGGTLVRELSEALARGVALGATEAASILQIASNLGRVPHSVAEQQLLEPLVEPLLHRTDAIMSASFAGDTEELVTTLNALCPLAGLIKVSVSNGGSAGGGLGRFAQLLLHRRDDALRVQAATCQCLHSLLVSNPSLRFRMQLAGKASLLLPSSHFVHSAICIRR
eukprot:SAG31_NODE_2578_length_5440_cov_1.848717_3_plen_224_part_00